MSRIKQMLRNPWEIVRYLARRGALRWLPDRQYLCVIYRAAIGKRLRLDDPKGFNEKLQWLKLYDRNPKYTTMVDKYLVREYVAEKIGEEYLIPLLGVWDDPEQIDFDKLPDQFVLKCNHDSGAVVICKDKSQLDIPAAKEFLSRRQKHNFYYGGREWPYKDVVPKIICEKYMEDESGELTDYKFMCFNGEVKCAFTCTDRFTPQGLHVTFYDMQWNIMPFERHYPRASVPAQKPQSYDEMVQLAEKLSAGIPFVRVDFYEIDGKPYFGELTFFPGNGLEEFTPEEWDDTLGSWISLPAREN